MQVVVGTSMCVQESLQGVERNVLLERLDFYLVRGKK